MSDSDPTPEPERQSEPSPEADRCCCMWYEPGLCITDPCRYPIHHQPAPKKLYTQADLDAAREQGRREVQVHVDYLHEEHGYCAFPGCT